MFTANPSAGATDYRQYAVWLISLLVIAFGFRYVKDIINLVLEKLYEVFIQQNPSL